MYCCCRLLFGESTIRFVIKKKFALKIFFTFALRILNFVFFLWNSKKEGQRWVEKFCFKSSVCSFLLIVKRNCRKNSTFLNNEAYLIKRLTWNTKSFNDALYPSTNCKFIQVCDFNFIYFLCTQQKCFWLNHRSENFSEYCGVGWFSISIRKFIILFE